MGPFCNYSGGQGERLAAINKTSCLLLVVSATSQCIIHVWHLCKMQRSLWLVSIHTGSSVYLFVKLPILLLLRSPVSD